MKKTIFKVITMVMLATFISSCESDDGTFDSLEGESKNISVEASTIDNSTTKAANGCHNWSIKRYEGPMWMDFRTRKVYPYVNTITIAEANCDGTWAATGGFKIIDNTHNKRTVRVKRINKNEGKLFFITGDGRYSVLTFDAFIYPDTTPPTVSCPTSEHTKMGQSFSKYVTASNYDEKYTYNWTVVNKGNTYYGTGSSIRLRGFGNFNVTLTVTLDGCTAQTRTQNFHVNIGR
ncbi:hypothetical protein ATO12_14495 [Aquimarina atlantica]|uniref:PKD domain-containing protein n=1 Tax=Aquimarina atlantica TaxID=1317122 RepID=A0A023BVR1_9FLAO|nr:hypothetical protein [Aquimarina atlantica]EZH74081.1 hypothetical protein ATO12_14495 [Aquimarina atlantica]